MMNSTAKCTATKIIFLERHVSSLKCMNENEARYTTSADIILPSGALWPPSTSLFKWNGINASRDLKQ
jgi:hypothetical protein